MRKRGLGLEVQPRGSATQLKNESWLTVTSVEADAEESQDKSDMDVGDLQRAAGNKRVSSIASRLTLQSGWLTTAVSSGFHPPSWEGHAPASSSADGKSPRSPARGERESRARQPSSTHHPLVGERTELLDLRRSGLGILAQSGSEEEEVTTTSSCILCDRPTATCSSWCAAGRSTFQDRFHPVSFWLAARPRRLSEFSRRLSQCEAIETTCMCSGYACVLLLFPCRLPSGPMRCCLG